jgi:hypothetical protein
MVLFVLSTPQTIRKDYDSEDSTHDLSSCPCLASLYNATSFPCDINRIGLHWPSWHWTRSHSLWDVSHWSSSFVIQIRVRDLHNYVNYSHDVPSAFCLVSGRFYIGDHYCPLICTFHDVKKFTYIGRIWFPFRLSVPYFIPPLKRKKNNEVSQSWLWNPFWLWK